MNTVNALTFRQKFGEIIDKVVTTGKPIVVERQNKPVAVLYPFEEKRQELNSLAEQEKHKHILDILANWRKRWGSELVKTGKTSTQILREMRENRYGKRWWKTRSNY